MSDDTFVLLEWAAAGHGILIGCPYTTGIDYVRNGTLSVVLPEWRMRDNLVFVYAAKRDLASLDKLLGVFMNQLKIASDTLEVAADYIFGFRK